MRDLRSPARAALLVAGAVCLLACQRADPEALYITGDFLEARKHYNAEACARLSEEAAKTCNERAAEISEALVGAAQYLGRRANERIRFGKQIQFNQYGEAVRSLELALAILPPDHPSRSDFSSGIERIRATQTALASELDQQLARLRALLEAGTYDPEVWNEVRLTFERVRVLVLAVGKADARPRDLARELMQQFRRHGRYEHARIAGDLLEAVDTAVQPRSTHTDNELVTLGIIDYIAQQQEAARQAKITALAREAIAAFEAKKGELAANKARAVLELGPNVRTARHMRAILENTEGATGQGVRARESRRVVAETSGDITPVPLAKAPSSAIEDDASASAAAPVKPAEPQVDRRPVPQRLKDLVRLYEDKQLYEAVSGLELLQRDARATADRRKVAELRRLWTPDRKKLIAETVAKADSLYVLMDEGSLAEYRRAQRLSPDGDIAKHVNERVQTLQRILSY